MLDTNKLIPKRKESARLSGKTITTIGLIKKDVVKIDSLLKEKLVLSKVRYGILKQQNERERRFNRESVLESKKSKSQDYEVNLKSNKKGKGFGGFLGGILKALLVGLGFTIFKSLPALLKIGKTIKAIATPFIIGATVFIGAISRIVRAGEKVLPDVRGKNFSGASEKSINDGINGLGRALIETALAFAGGALAGMGVSRLVRGKTFTEKQYVSQLQQKIKKLEKTKGRIRPIKKMASSGAEPVFDRITTIDDLAENIYDQRSGRKIKKKITAGSTPSTIDDLSKMNPDQRARVLGGAEFADSNFSSEQTANIAVDATKKIRKQKQTLGVFSADQTGSEIIIRQRMKQSMNPFIRALQPEFDVLSQSPIFDSYSETQKQSLLLDLMNDEKKRLAKTSLSKIRKQDELLYKRIIDAKTEIAKEKLTAKIQRAKLDQTSQVGTGRSGTKVRKGGKIFRRPDGTSTIDAYEAAQKKIFGKTFKMSGEKVAVGASKKGLSKILFRVGGEAFEQSVKQTIKASVGVIPIIGDLIGFLLDVFLFGQPVGRAAFMATGSLLGGLIGGVFGLIGGPPGAFVGSILGGIGGDLLGGALYDLIFEGGAGARITDNISESFVKKGVKAGVGMGFMRGGYAPFGGIVHAGEFVMDADSTRAIERQSPGFLMALNKAKGSQIDEVLETYMSYGNDGEGSETLIPLPVEKIVTRTVVTNTGTKDNSSSPFMDLYRRG